MVHRLWIFLLSCVALIAVLFGFGLISPAQAQSASSGSSIQRAVMVRQARIYLEPDTSSAKLAEIDRGNEVAILEKGGGQWLHVMGTVVEDPERGNKQVTGWIVDKGVIRSSTPDGDRILFGEAAGAEAEASRRGGRRGAAMDARRLYYRTWEYFPNSPVAGEALYRAADIQWQVDRAEFVARPSYKENPKDRLYGINEKAMKQVIKKYPNSKWADLAAFSLIDNKLCGEWKGLAKCPEDEAKVYEKYAEEHPQSPKLQESLYEAARRRAALIEIYQGDNKTSDSESARKKLLDLVQRIVAAGRDSDWAMRAQSLAYKVQQQIPVYGNAIQ